MQYQTLSHDWSRVLTKCRINYTIPMGEPTIAALMGMRKEYMQHREDMLSYQRACTGAGDTVGARFFKEESAEAMKMYRAACLLIPHFSSEHPGDCKLQDAWDWPPDLFNCIDRVMAFAELRAS